MKKLTLTLALAIAATFSFAQKKNVQTAGIAYSDFEEKFAAGDYEGAKTEIMDAKKYIDLAAAHEDTKNSPKMFFYKGKIYIGIAEVTPMIEGGIEGVDPGKAMEEGFSSLMKSKEVDSKKRYVDDVNQFAAVGRAKLSNQGVKSFEEGKYTEAMAGLLGGAKFGEVMGMVDSTNYFFGGLAAYNAKEYGVVVEALGKSLEIGYNPGESLQYLVPAMKEEGVDAATIEKTILDAQAKYPNDLNVMIQAINHYIDSDRKDDAAEALQKAIDLDPENVALLYTSGNIYEEMGRKDAAETAFLKAVELAPEDVDALYPMGVHYFNRGADRNNEANKMELGDPNYEPYLAEADAYFKKSLGYLERAAEQSPKDKDILESLKLVYGKLKMMDKFKETKARIQELE